MKAQSSQLSEDFSTKPIPMLTANQDRRQTGLKHQQTGEPQLPDGYRHVRSALEVLLAWAKESPQQAETLFEPISTAVWTFLLKPLSREEFGAHMGSILAQRSEVSSGKVSRFGNVRVDFSSMEVSRSSGEPVVLTAQEFKTLKFFLLNPGRVISRDELLNHAWGYNNYPCSRTVDNHVLRLRQKLEPDPSRPVHFRTVRRVGYRFVL